MKVSSVRSASVQREKASTEKMKNKRERERILSIVSSDVTIVIGGGKKRSGGGMKKQKQWK
jgi:hypothetical protein